MTPSIITPRGKISLDKNNKAVLEFNSSFETRFQKQYTTAQKFMDSEILRLSEPFIPLLAGVLIKSGILGTIIGSGLVRWIAPYAAAQYYSPRKAGSQTGKQRGPYWFERGKDVWGKGLVEKAKSLAGGGR